MKVKEKVRDKYLIRQDFLPFHSPTIEEDEIAEVVDTLRSGWITTGPKTKQFEEEFARYIGCKHAIAVNSGTAALHLALDAAGIKAGDEVLVPTLTFAATAEVVLYLKATPILVDCKKDTFNIDPDRIEEIILKLKAEGSKLKAKNPNLKAEGSPVEYASHSTGQARVKAIVPVHFGGLPCDMDMILKIAEKYDLKVIEDAAHALPAKCRIKDSGLKDAGLEKPSSVYRLPLTKKVGTIGDITAFSFYANKNITTGEGGMITTENDEYAEKMRIMSLHGISKDAWKRYMAEGSWYYEIIYPGHKYNITDIASAIGIHQLRKCDRFYERRKEIAKMYTEGLADLEEIIIPPGSLSFTNHDYQHAWHLYVILIRPELLKINRSQFIEKLKKKNIGTSVHFMPLHLHPYYRNTFGYRRGDFPNAEYIFDRCVSLPIYPKMRDDDVGYVIEAIREIVHKYV